ncbi:sugar ABC transporter substrate-binding protein [Paenibacillus sp. J5C_2022]|uniref:sugar ABC transporter substrate-binding protein n=1 Tax=Paenibacillus sp. J5C2022 TaxID=2977129 RepID=UPI0021D32322|nr:sugar ABC transporter substrate-binding protein [Paenibacillus sp. J5C2022]MCU6709629.1 sugar ABC transporter substrate-binding protein [Paenibacillus sp. J5C2022]
MKKGWVKLFTAALLVSTVLAGCSAGGNANEANGSLQNESVTKDGDEMVIGGAIMNLGWPWYQGTIDGMKNYVEKSGKNIKLQFEDGKFDINTQITQLENMVQLGAKGVVVFPVDGKAIIPTMVKLKEQGVKVVVGDYPQSPDNPEDAVWETFVGHDFKEMGIAAGEIAVNYLKTLNKSNPTVAYLSVPASGQASVDRFEGFSSTVKAAFPNAEVIEEGDPKGDRNSAQTLFENVMQRNKNIDVVSGHNDALVLGAYNGAVGANRDKEIKFIGMAGDKEVLQFIQDGNASWLGEVLQDPVILGEVALEALMAALEGEQLEDVTPLPKPEVITPENIDDYDWQNWSWLGN